MASLRLYEDLRASREQILTAREAERWRLRRDIHDGIGPVLSALRPRIDTARAAVSDTAPVAAPPAHISDDLAELIDEVRRVSAGLVPGALAEVGLGAAVRALAERLDHTALRIDVRLRPDPLPHLPAATRTAAYRITAEALTNLVRLARARAAHVTLTTDETALVIQVRDDGIGIAPNRSSTGVGLWSMADRARGRVSKPRPTSLAWRLAARPGLGERGIASRSARLRSPPASLHRPGHAFARAAEATSRQGLVFCA